MNDHAILWTWLFVAITAALLLAPMVPAWREWASPQDNAALPIPAERARATAAAPCYRLTALTPAPSSIKASQCIMAMPGSQFHQLSAPRIELGSVLTGATWPVAATGTRCMVLKDLPHATPWGEGGWRVEGDCRIPASHQLTGSLVVTGCLSVEHDCLIDGSIKAHGDIHIAARTVVTGSVIGEQNIWLGQACQVHGPVISQHRLHLGHAVVLGKAQHPTSVDAHEITAERGALVHGSVWARQLGRVT